MFGIHIITDIIKIPASDLHYENVIMTTNANKNTASNSKVVNTMSNNNNDNNDTTIVAGSTGTKTNHQRTKKSLLPIIHREIDIIYPNRVIMNVGLVISRYYCTTTSPSQPLNRDQHDVTTTSSLENQNGSLTTNKQSIESNISNSITKKRKRQSMNTSTATTTTKYQRRIRVLQQYGTKLLQNGGTCNGSTVHYTVSFPVIVFCPYIDEILIGTIYDMNHNGIIVTLGHFFSAIYIPKMFMLHPSFYEDDISPVTVVSGRNNNTTTTSSTNTNGVWVWTPSYDDDTNDNENENEPLRYEMNIGDEIRVRVKSIHYYNTKQQQQQHMVNHPIIASSTANSSNNTSSNNNNTNTNAPTNTNSNSNDTLSNINQHKQQKHLSSTTTTTNTNTTTTNNTTSTLNCSMYIIASICEDGLGLTSWWSNSNNTDENDENDNNDNEDGTNNGDNDDVYNEENNDEEEDVVEE